MSDLTEWRPGETTAQWVERVTGEILTANQTAAVDALLHRSALAGETNAVEAAVAVACQTKEVNVAIHEFADFVLALGAIGFGGKEIAEKKFVSAVVVAAAPILRAPLLLQLQDREERIKALEGEVEDIQNAMWCILAQGTGRAVITRKQIQERPTRARLKTATDVLGNLEIVAIKEAP